MGTVVLIILALLILYIAFRFFKGTRNSELRSGGENHLPDGAAADGAPAEDGIDAADVSDAADDTGSFGADGPADSPDSSDSGRD